MDWIWYILTCSFVVFMMFKISPTTGFVFLGLIIMYSYLFLAPVIKNRLEEMSFLRKYGKKEKHDNS